MNHTDQELIEMAKKIGTRAILELADLPNDFSVYRDSDTLKLCKTVGVIISADGTIYTSDPVNVTSIERVKNYLVNEQKFKSNELKICPANNDVIVSLTHGHQSNDANEDVEENKEKDSQARIDLEALFKRAIKLGSSDIHIDARPSKVTVRMRVAGSLQQVHSVFAFGHAVAIASVVVDYLAANSEGGSGTHFKTTEPLDATLRLTLEGKEVKFRFASTPRAGGFKVVLRLLDSNDMSENKGTLETLGYLPEQKSLIEQIASAPQGLVMVGGPTGSGKTTTMAMIMSGLPEDKSLYSYEDPVEIENSRICQVMVQPGSEKCDWKHYAKNTLRMDPDAIMYGELREPVVAQQVVYAASTGHLVISTVHTNSAPSIVQRLNDLGIEYTRLGEPEFLKLLVFQRLLPSTCQECGIPFADYYPTDVIERQRVVRLKKYFSNKKGFDEIKIANLQGCMTCNHTGKNGRTLVAEVVRVDDVGRDYIREGNMNGWLKHLKEMGWKSVLDHAEINVLDGVLCPIKAEEALGKHFDDKIAAEKFNYKSFRDELKCDNDTLNRNSAQREESILCRLGVSECTS